MERDEASICPLCRHENVKIYSVGVCSHAVCNRCSIKMRILCEQTYCAICRQELPRVYLVPDLSSVGSISNESLFTPIDDTGDCGVYYPKKSDWIRRETEKLLRNYCPFCHSEYESFETLREHVKRAHRYSYCDLCVEHLNLFPFERKCYTRKDLYQHMRHGDRDDTSFKGHAFCKFCDDYFFDVDHLYKHMREKHFYCHLCTMDNVYYSDFDLLRDHYRSSHYLCEIGECKETQFTNVFSSEIEFRRHQSTQHSKNRAEARQLGTLPLEFQSKSTRDRRQQRDPTHRGTFKSGQFSTQGNLDNSQENDHATTQPEPAVPASVPSIDEFPTLGESSSTSSHSTQQRGVWLNDPLRRIHSSDDFPALVAANRNTSASTTGHSRGIWHEQQQASASTNQSVVQMKTAKPVQTTASGIGPRMNKEDFPELKGSVSAKMPGQVSTFTAWSTAKKNTKQASAHNKSSQAQLRMNASRLLDDDDDDDDDDEYVRRPMTTLTTSTAPIASSNISIISSSELPKAKINENNNGNKIKTMLLQSNQDFPALPSTKTSQAHTVDSGFWGSSEDRSPASSSTTQNKKKNSKSKKQFLEEIQAMPPVPTSKSSIADLPTISLNELGRRLIVEENDSTVKSNVDEDKTSPPQTSSTKSEKKKKQQAEDANNLTKRENLSVKNETLTKSTVTQKSSIPEADNISSSQATSSTLLVQPPPGFAPSSTISPPPGFNLIPPSQTKSPTFIFHSNYSKHKRELHDKLVNLFDGNENLTAEYENFCHGYSIKQITTPDFLKFTTELFKDKLGEYLLDIIMTITSIEQQNEIYSVWTNDMKSTTALNTKNWTKKSNTAGKDTYVCRTCQQIMFTDQIDEHNTHHNEFNNDFPSLPSAAVSLGRGSGKKKK